MLGFVQGFVGAGDELLHRFVGLERSQAQRQRDLANVCVVMGFNAVPNAFGQQHAWRLLAMFEQHQKLFTTPANDAISAANRRTQDVRYIAKHAVTRQVAEAVVDLLEVVNVTDKQRE